MANVPHGVISPTGAPWTRADQQQGPPMPPPELNAVEPAMPPVVDMAAVRHCTWQPAHKRITSSGDLSAFLNSDSLRSLMAFILHVNSCCIGKKLSELAAPSTLSPQVQQLLKLLSTLDTWVDEIPPSQQSLRYGNPAFRTWHERLVQRVGQLLTSCLPEELHPAIPELIPYVTDSFGNPIRIDYGTGHELTFCALLHCLARLGFVKEADGGALGGAVFASYIALMRRIQTTYWLEPAGSHGVWGLDDYQFMPFIWGSAQLCQHPMIRPRSIHSQETMEAYASEYLYLAAVKFVKQVKKGPLQETAPIICDVAAVPNWQKVNSGMVKMYQVEVLSKLPIMQHFLFGHLLPFPEPHTDVEPPTTEAAAQPSTTEAAAEPSKTEAAAEPFTTEAAAGSS